MSLSDKIFVEYGFGEESLDVEDVKEFIEHIKVIKKMFSDLSVTCPICNKGKRLWVHGKSNCYDCEINKLAGESLIK